MSKLKVKQQLILLLTFIPFLSFTATNHTLLKDHYPQKYIVKKGDTIYEIAEKYLNKPWQWRKIWKDNPHIKNPKLIYPGTVLVLRYYEGKPHLTVDRHGTYKLSPQSRIRPAEKAIPPIHLTDIKPFLNKSRIFDVDELATAGYVIAFKNEHLRGGQDDQIYVKNLQHYSKSGLSYAIYRPGGIYKNPKYPNLCLGYKADFIGDAQVVKGGDTATLELTQISKGVEIKDRVIINNKPSFDLYFEPKAPNIKVAGNVIETLSEFDQVASNQGVVIDQGRNSKLEAGDVIILWQDPKVIQDPLDKDNFITLPRQKLGEAMIFKTFSYASFALIMSSTRSIKSGDSYTSP